MSKKNIKMLSMILAILVIVLLVAGTVVAQGKGVGSGGTPPGLGGPIPGQGNPPSLGEFPGGDRSPANPPPFDRGTPGNGDNGNGDNGNGDNGNGDNGNGDNGNGDNGNGDNGNGFESAAPTGTISGGGFLGGQPAGLTGTPGTPGDQGLDVPPEAPATLPQTGGSVLPMLGLSFILAGSGIVLRKYTG